MKAIMHRVDLRHHQNGTEVILRTVATGSGRLNNQPDASARSQVPASPYTPSSSRALVRWTSSRPGSTAS
jgi:hypothetical protein